MAGNEEEAELDNTIQQEPQPGLKEEGWMKKVTQPLQMFLAVIFYFYVVVIIFLILVVPASINPILNHPINDSGNSTINNEALHIAKSLLQNGLLLFLFVIQHSFMPLVNIDYWLTQLNMGTYTRAFYSFMSCVTLQIIYYFWCPLESYYIWNCKDDSTVFYVVMVILHVMCWSSIGCSLFIVDHMELIGVKQLYYHYLGTTDPLSFKAWENHELLRHMRHPVFLSPLVILWAVPRMTYDRIFVAILLPVYLIWSSKLGNEDVLYVNEMYQKKKRFLWSGNKTD